MYYYKLLIDIKYLFIYMLFIKVFKQAQIPYPDHKSNCNLNQAYLEYGDNITNKVFHKYVPKELSIVMVKINFPEAKVLFTTRN